MKNGRILSTTISLVLLSLGSVAVVAAYSANATQQSALPTFPEEESKTLSDSPPLDAPQVRQPVNPDVDSEQQVDTAAPILETRKQKILAEIAAESNIAGSKLDLFGDLLAASEWDQAKPEEVSLLQNVRRTHVRFLDPTGSLNGRVSVAGDSGGESAFFDAEYTIELIQQGRVVRSTRLMPNGRFSFEGLSKGPYGVFLRGGKTLLSYSLYLGDEADLAQANYSTKAIEFIYATQSTKAKELVLPVTSLSTPRGDYPAIRALIESRIRGSESMLPLQYHQNQLYIPENLDLANAFPGTSLSAHKIHLLPSGDMIGRTRKIVFLKQRNQYAYVPATNVEINLIRNNQVVATTRTNGEGVFRIKNLEPGVYSVVGHDPGLEPDPERAAIDLNQERIRDGFGIIGIEAVPWPDDALDPKRPTAANSIIDQLTYVVTLQNQEAGSATEVAQQGSESPLFLDLGLSELPPDPFEEEAPPFQPAPLAGGGVGGGGAAGGGLDGFIPGLLLGLTPFLFDDDDQSPVAP